MDTADSQHRGLCLERIAQQSGTSQRQRPCSQPWATIRASQSLRGSVGMDRSPVLASVREPRSHGRRSPSIFTSSLMPVSCEDVSKGVSGSGSWSRAASMWRANASTIYHSSGTRRSGGCKCLLRSNHELRLDGVCCVLQTCLRRILAKCFLETCGNSRRGCGLLSQTDDDRPSHATRFPVSAYAM